MGFKVTVFKTGVGSVHYDHFIAEYARRNGAIIVTTDEWFRWEQGYDKVIVLPQGSKLRTQSGKKKRWTYEEWWTELCRQLHKLLRNTISRPR